MRWKITFLIVLFLVPAAFADPKFFIDPSGNIYKSWLENESSGEATILKCSRSIDHGLFFGPPQDLLSITNEVGSYDLKIEGGSSYLLVYESSGEVRYTVSHGGSEFTPPLIISKNGIKPTLAYAPLHQAVVWQDMDNSSIISYMFLQSSDPSLVNKIYSIEHSGEAISSPSSSFDPSGNLLLTYIAEEPYSGLKTLYHSSLLTSPETTAIFKSYSEIRNPGFGSSSWGTVVFWELSDPLRTESFVSASLDYGRHFGDPVPLPSADHLLYFGFIANRWQAFISAESTFFTDISFPSPAAPEIISPANNYATACGSVEIVYQKGAEPCLIKIEVSSDLQFIPANTWSFDILNVSPSPEANYQLPLEIAEGTYYLRLSGFNGFADSAFSSPRKIVIDKTAPLITLSSPSEESSEQQEIVVEGRISEMIPIDINGVLVTPEADGQFKVAVKLNPGGNALSFSATDEAGNSISLKRSIYYSNLLPEIQITKPGETDWFKPGSTILIIASVKDAQEDVPDEAEATVNVRGTPLEDRLYYDKSSSELSGFVTIPSNLAEGKTPAAIILKDSEGNAGKKSFYLNLDQSSPLITISPGGTAFSDSGSEIELPLIDHGAGIDPSGTMVRITGISCEGYGTGESQELLIKPTLLLQDGSYEVEIIPRDLVGNTGPLSCFNLVVDTVPPDLVLLSSAESRTTNGTISIRASADDPYFAGFKVYNNHRLVKNDPSSDPLLNCDVQLFPGTNLIEIQAWDQAGNRATRSLSLYAALAGSSTFFNSCQNGPNPFSPVRDDLAYFTFDLSASAEVEVYIFDLSGTLICKQTQPNTPAGKGNFTWNGRDQFGRMVDNGVYPYLLRAFSGVENEIKRGKIIIYQ